MSYQRFGEKIFAGGLFSLSSSTASLLLLSSNCENLQLREAFSKNEMNWGTEMKPTRLLPCPGLNRRVRRGAIAVYRIVFAMAALLDKQPSPIWLAQDRDRIG